MALRGLHEPEPLRPAYRKALKIAAHLVAVTGLYLAFSGALFLGLQFDVLYGSVAVVVAVGLIALYVYFGFMRK